MKKWKLLEKLSLNKKLILHKKNYINTEKIKITQEKLKLH